ncbi:MAG: hypothetical protein F4Y91_21960 [Gemmatimonadetes bacterium]|nr:hypothetical protein [Gemmatimonadota bacterium]MYB70988.1 hypothetical protein [Gemmatimonadota bacterium]
MNQLLSIVLLLSFVGTSFAANEVNVHAVAIGSNRPTEGMDASVFGNGQFADVRSASSPIGELAHTYKVKGDNPDTTKASRVARVTRKLLYGAGTGMVAVFIVLSGNFGWCDDNSPESCGEFIWNEEREFLFIPLLIPMNIAMGVSASDQRDRFIYPLAASMLGFGMGIAYGAATYEWLPSLWLPILTATAASEWSRSRVDSHRYSLGLRPEPGGGLSMVATLRFQ